ncbi:MAG: diacylglycerol kinase family lipid kinase [Bacteroidetes bacterium]|nr:diacylglycerol kinase family lipid kinase [Bacteroidota bacterium]
MTQHKILFVINPVSGNTDKTIFLDLLKTKSRDPEYTFSTYLTTGKNDAAKIKSEIDRLKPATVVAVGGDGTVKLVASLLVNTPISLGIIPMGSANGLAFELKLPTEVSTGLELILEGNTRRIDAIRINGQTSFHLSDLGINSRIIKGFDENEKRGFWGYLRSFLKESKHMQRFRCTIETNGKKIRHHAMMVVIANGSYYGTGANINPTGALNDGQFEIILVKPHSLKLMLKLSVDFFTHSLHKHESTRVVSCTSAEINVQPQQFLQIDGEIQTETNHVTAEVIPGAIQVIAGKEKS